MQKLEGVDAELTLDANAVAGLLQQVFAIEMTATPAECAHCGTVGEIGALRAFVRAPGAVLRCVACGGVVLRIVETDRDILVDVRGASRLRLARDR
ncbi:MAG: DUF6510 family protein [Chloroflexota bacterium]|nr:DUF6510 family protein [Chloroflexota bacterium]